MIGKKRGSQNLLSKVGKYELTDWKTFLFCVNLMGNWLPGSLSLHDGLNLSMNVLHHKFDLTALADISVLLNEVAKSDCANSSLVFLTPKQSRIFTIKCPVPYLSHLYSCFYSSIASICTLLLCFPDEDGDKEIVLPTGSQKWTANLTFYTGNYLQQGSGSF